MTPEQLLETRAAQYAECLRIADVAREELKKALVSGRDAGISEVRLAKMAGVTRRTVRRWTGSDAVDDSGTSADDSLPSDEEVRSSDEESCLSEEGVSDEDSGQEEDSGPEEEDVPEVASPDT